MMTREEAVLILKNMLRGEVMPVYLPKQKRAAFRLALTALRPVSREQVEKVWRGEWEEERFAGELEGWQHRECGRHSAEKSMWCPKCGKAMTDEAVQMVMERLEELKDAGN